MNPTLIDLGFLQIKWYSFLILIGFIIGYVLIINKCKKKKIQLNIINDMCFYLVIFCILGARIYYCIFNFDYYRESIIDVFKIWEGGLAIHGGIIAGLLVIMFYCKKYNFKLLEILDIFAPSLVLGQAIGRWGNFFNGEAYGPITTLSTLRNLKTPQFIIDGMYIDHNYHHPTFFYESIGCLLIFLILVMLKKFKKEKTGETISIYLILYGIIRFFIESLRTDSLMLFNIKVAQIVSIIMIFIGLFIFIKLIYKEKMLGVKNDK